MTTKDLIAKIDHYVSVFAPMLEPNNLPYMHLMPSDLRDIPAQQFVELCDHYKAEPFVSALPTAWMKVGAVEVYVASERLNVAVPDKKGDALDKLKLLVNQA